jgi:hypothetical protein
MTRIPFRLSGSTPESRPLAEDCSFEPILRSSFSVSENIALMRSRHFVLTSTFAGSRKSDTRSEYVNSCMPTVLPHMNKHVFYYVELLKKQNFEVLGEALDCFEVIETFDVSAEETRNSEH